MNAHTRFALPINTHGNLKHLHDKAQANDGNGKTDNQAPEEVTATKQRRDSSSFKLAQKMKMLFPSRKTTAKSTSEQEEAVVNERQRSTMSQLVGSHAFVQRGRR